jgi:hypothetical protein
MKANTWAQKRRSLNWVQLLSDAVRHVTGALCQDRPFALHPRNLCRRVKATTLTVLLGRRHLRTIFAVGIENSMKSRQIVYLRLGHLRDKAGDEVE